eukprot:TRINITY_DN2456_c0_g2_i5.p1 TRINITY_DN2456_c0_g2~~TRINITY_DN2456_c0_g2_i5.p1  ORF type:complete len:111 (+),score=8.82 TRINITY_DN2456_c0_g2_i5:239-571(+)
MSKIKESGITITAASRFSPTTTILQKIPHHEGQVMLALVAETAHLTHELPTSSTQCKPQIPNCGADPKIPVSATPSSLFHRSSIPRRRHPGLQYPLTQLSLSPLLDLRFH